MAPFEAVPRPLLLVLAILGGLGPVITAALGGSAVMGGWLPILVALVAIPVAAGSGPRRLVATLGLLLAFVSGFLAREAPALMPVAGVAGSVPTIDLAQDAFPDDAPVYVEVVGFYRDQWKLDEYATPQGGRPDQSRPATAVLVPFVGTPQDTIALDGSIVVARVPSGNEEAEDQQTIRGRVKPLDPQLLATLVQVAGARSMPTGVLIDTFDAPTKGSAWVRLIALLVVTLGGLACLVIAASGPAPARRPA